MLNQEEIAAYKLPNMPADFDAWRELGVPHGASVAEVDAAWSKTPTNERNINNHFAWKVLRDPAYAALLEERRNIPAIYEAGFFVDKIPLEQVDTLTGNRRDFTTPIFKVAENMKDFDYSKGRPVVLLSTGGFSPIHWGHMSMMKTAKQALEAQGRSVVGAYLSPSHDDYVSQKHNGSAKLTARHRIHIAHLSAEEEEYKKWLMVDPFEAEYLPTDVNFTDIIRHLKSDLEEYVDSRGFDVFYVSGADNAGFIDVLKYLDGGVIVSRGTNFDVIPEIFTRPEIVENPSLLFVNSGAETSEFSSSSVRRWKPQLMPADVSNIYTKWRVSMMRTDNDIAPPQRSYMVRDDGAWAMHQFFPDGPDYKTVEALNAFKSGLSAAIKAAYLEVEEPDLPRHINVHYLDLGEQAAYAKKLSNEQNILNLDVCTNGNDGINFSRLFPVADGQIRPLDLIARPGFEDIETQIAKIEPGEYVLVDDDIASGSTVNHLMGMLPEDVKVTSFQTLFNHSCRLHSDLVINEMSDMVDLRDFIIGAYSAGLVVQGIDANSVARVPYMLPFVSLNSRAQIPLSSMRKFSERCWTLNAEFFEAIGDELTLGSAADEFKTIMLQLGFDETTKMSEIARHYERTLQRTETVTQELFI